ncbi:hypothetical protein KPB2_5357 [Klebsiella pneumoniae Kb677]|nr:hypothetical protein KPB2_5357 [Klebsiella pneumoniae Kb677]
MTKRGGRGIAALAEKEAIGEGLGWYGPACWASGPAAANQQAVRRRVGGRSVSTLADTTTCKTCCIPTTTTSRDPEKTGARGLIEIEGRGSSKEGPTVPCVNVLVRPDCGGNPAVDWGQAVLCCSAFGHRLPVSSMGKVGQRPRRGTRNPIIKPRRTFYGTEAGLGAGTQPKRCLYRKGRRPGKPVKRKERVIRGIGRDTRL